jgi:hypothetical protein
MHKYIRITFIFLAITLSVFLLLSGFVFIKMKYIDDVSNIISTSFKNQIGYEIKSSDNDILVFPYPKITFQNVIIIDTKTGKTQITADNTSFNLSLINVLTNNYNNINTNWINANALIIDNNNNELFKLQNIDLDIILSEKENKFVITEHNNADNNINILYDNNHKLLVNGDSDFLKINIVDNKINAQIKNSRLLKIINFHDDKLATILDNGKINISSDLTFDNEVIALKNIIISGDVIDAKGSFIKKLSDNDANLNLDITKIILDNKPKSTSQSNNTEIFKFISPINIHSNIKIANITHDKQDVASDIVIDANINNASTKVNKLSGKLFTDNNFAIENFIYGHNIDKQIGELKGKIYISGNNFANFITNFYDFGYNSKETDKFIINADIVINQNQVALQNIIANIGKSTLNGELYTTIESSPKTNLTLNINNLNLDEYSLSDDLQSFLTQYFYGNESQIFTTHDNLRRLKQEYNANINIGMLNFAGRIFSDFHIDGKISKGNVLINNIHLESPELVNVDIKSSLNVITLKPVLTVETTGTLLKSELFSILMPDKKAIELTTSPKLTDTNSNNIWENNKIPIANFKKFDGYIVAAITDMWVNNILINNFDYRARMQNNMMIIDHILGNSLGGKININGTASFNPNSFNLAYSLEALSVGELMQNIFDKNNIGGKVSISGNIGLYGSSQAEFIRNMQLTLAFAARNVEVQNMNLDSIVIESSKAQNSDRTNLEKVMNEALISGVTKFNEINGQIAGSNGMFMINNTNAVTDYTAMNINGKLNLFEWNMDINAKAAYKIRNNADNGIYDIRFLGNIDNPDQQIDKNAIRNYIDLLDRYGFY